MQEKSVNTFVDPSNKLPREKRLTWQDRHMMEAILSSFRSPDPNTQVGACLINKNNRVIATGYNSFPNKVCTRAFSWERSHEDPLKTKYPFVVHAEKNAIYNASSKVEGSTLYVTMYPCGECAKDIIQAGISGIVYLINPYENTWQIEASKQMFQIIDMPVVQHKWQDKETVLSCLQTMINLLNSTM